jgi:hypothetical protein
MAAPVIVPAVRTGGTDRDRWIRSRHAALVSELMRRGMVRSSAWAMAMAPVAHWGDECGWGRAEWNYAVGNIRSVGQCPLAHMLQGGDDSVPRPYCAYRTLDEGVSHTLDLILAPRYAAAWQYLTSSGDAVGWFERLLHSGWHPYSAASVNSFRSEYARVQRTVGSDPSPAGPTSSSTWPWVAAVALLVGATYVIVATGPAPRRMPP